MSRSQKNKGYRVEKKIEAMLNDGGMVAKRMPLSGAAPGFKGDIQVATSGDPVLVEVKARKEGAGFKTLESWKQGSDLLMLHRDRTEPMVVMDFSLFLKIAKGEVDFQTSENTCRELQDTPSTE